MVKTIFDKTQVFRKKINILCSNLQKSGGESFETGGSWIKNFLGDEYLGLKLGHRQNLRYVCKGRSLVTAHAKLVVKNHKTYINQK